MPTTTDTKHAIFSVKHEFKSTTTLEFFMLFVCTIHKHNWLGRLKKSFHWFSITTITTPSVKKGHCCMKLRQDQNCRDSPFYLNTHESTWTWHLHRSIMLSCHGEILRETLREYFLSNKWNLQLSMIVVWNPVILWNTTPTYTIVITDPKIL